MSRSPRTGVLLPVALALFAVGVVAVVAVFALFAAGRRDLPLWLNAACLLAPAGLALALVAAVLRARR